MKCIWLLSWCISVFLIITLCKNCEGYPELSVGSDSSFSQESSCNKTETIEFISSLRSENLVPHTKEYTILIISDTENHMYGPLIEKPTKYSDDCKIEFIPVPQKWKKVDIRQTFRKVLQVDSWNFLSIIILAEGIDRVGEIFQDFTNIFGNVSSFIDNIHFGVTLDHDEDDDTILKKLEDVGQKSKRTDVIQLVEYLGRNLEKRIKVFNNQSSESTNDNKTLDMVRVLTFAQPKDPKSILSQDFQELIKCSISQENRTILSDMKNFASKLEVYFSDEPNKTDDISELHRAYKFKEYNTDLWLAGNFILPSTENPIVFLKKMRGLVEKLNITNKYEQLYSYQYMTVIQLLLNVSSDHHTFSTTAKAWSQQLREFRIKNSKLARWYELDKSGLLYPRNFDNFTICTRIMEGQRLLVRANFIRLSDVKFNKCSGDVRLIEIFATEKVFIDEDLDQVGKMLQVVIIAPTWEIIGNRKFNLNGEDGKEPVEFRAKDGSIPENKNGAHGVAGLPGGPAGSFYGIADTIINGRNLTILANGGKGGPGQDGGHGTNGENGESYEGAPRFECKNGKAPDLRSIFYKPATESITQYNKSTTFKLKCYKIKGKAGKRGGRGGNGGVGGTGGKGGNIIVQQLLKHDLGMDPVISAENGEKGSGGFGGKNGNVMEVECTEFDYYGRDSTAKREHTGFAECGLLGKPGTSLKMRESPKNPVIVQNFPTSLNKYKMFARMQLAELDLDQRNILSKFYDSLNTQEEVAKWYDTLSLVEEFTGLEMQYLGLHKRVNLTSSYQALRKRIQNYAENPYKKNEKTQDYHDVLRDLHSDILEKIRNIYRSKEYSLVTNIKEIIDILAEESVKRMLDSVKIDNISFSLNKEKQSLNSIIEKVQYKITEEIQPVMNDLENTLDEEINALLIENSELQKKADDKMDELAENLKQLDHNILLKGVFGVLKVGCEVLGRIYLAEYEMLIPDSFRDASKATEKIFKAEKMQQLYDQQRNFLEKNEKAKIKSNNDQNKIDEVEKALQQTKEGLEKLNQYEEQIYDVTKYMADRSITEITKNVQNIMKDMTKGFPVTEDITRTLDKLISTFEFIITMHPKVLEYQRNIQEQTSIAELYINFSIYLLTSDSRLISAWARLKVFLSYNFVSDSYDKCVSAFKQFAFPQAGFVLERLKSLDVLVSSKLFNSIHDIKKNVISLKKSMEHEEESYELLRIFGRGIFMGSPSSMPAFYTWRSEKHKTEIQNILSGKKTKLVANITQESLNALKFNKFGVVFTCKNHEILDMLNGALENFKVDLTHHGDSVYKCGDGIYEIRNAPINVVYSFRKDSKGEPVFQNGMYEKITNGECMLSPFATWSVQLLSNARDFQILDQFKDKVDLELIGHGKYVEEPNVKCENNMEKYYTKIGSFN